MDNESLISYFDNYLPLNKTEIEELSNRLIERKIRRRQFLLQEFDICKHFTFVLKGCFKMYAIDIKGDEHIIQFIAENDWTADLASLHKEKPSALFIEALEPSTVLQISKKDLWHLYTLFPKFDRNFRVIIEDKFTDLQNRMLETISLSAEQRYLGFLEKYPQLAKRLPNTQIAAYLGVTPEFLSRIRKDLVKK